jgi:hypothetical protein
MPTGRFKRTFEVRHRGRIADTNDPASSIWARWPALSYPHCWSTWCPFHVPHRVGNRGAAKEVMDQPCPHELGVIVPIAVDGESERDALRSRM